MLRTIMPKVRRKVKTPRVVEKPRINLKGDGRVNRMRGKPLSASASVDNHPSVTREQCCSSHDSTVTASSAFKCERSFYDVPCVTLANKLLGQVLVSTLDDGKRLSGRIVETESYLGGDDKGSNSFNGRRTPGNVAMFMKPGTLYVYMTYGMYHCMNISSQGDGAAVLIRALEPLEGLEEMRKFRGAKRKDGGSTLKNSQLCNGPSKTCMAMCINKENGDQKDLVTSKSFWIESDEPVASNNIVQAPRIGIGPAAGDWRLKPLRFYIRGNEYVSVRKKEAEKDT